MGKRPVRRGVTHGGQLLVLATIDYYLDPQTMQFKTENFDSEEHFKGLKVQTEEHFQKGRLTRLKQWFRELTKMQVETGDLKFHKYLKDKTKYDIDIFKSPVVTDLQSVT